MIVEYTYIFKFYIFCMLISTFMFSISFFLVYRSPDTEKISSYECGFNPFSTASNKVEINFFLVGMLFMIFDLELTFLLPWALSMAFMTTTGMVVMLVFIIFLTVGFVYDWYSDILEW